MQWNQPFYGNGFANGPFGSPFNTPLQPTQGMYPEVVGEGQVTSVTLSDGSVQFFFMPTLQWWSPNAAQCNPIQTIPNPMFANNNYSIPPPYNNNVGTWFIRSISNQFPQSAFNPSSQRNELPRLAINADYNHNLINHDLGYQVKFHNDGGTSTTDLVYFYPSLRQRDFVFMPPCKDKTVQIDTGSLTNTVCHYQVVCSKQCNCSIVAKPMSLENLVEPNLTPMSNRPHNYSADANKPMSSSESLVDPNPNPKSNNTSTDDSSYRKEQNKRARNKKKNIIICDCNSEDKKNKQKKSRNIISDCYPTVNVVSVDKSITTYADESVGSNPTDGRETQTSRTEDITLQCDVDAKPINKSPQKTKWIDKGCSSECSTCDERLCDDISDKKHTQRNKGGKYKRSKPNKCECGCCYCDSSVDCCTDSEVEKVESKDKGRETPFPCSTCSNITVLEKPKGSPIKIGKKASIGKANSSLQWLTLNNVSQKCELMEEEYPEKLLDHTCTECDTAASTSGGGYV